MNEILQQRIEEAAAAIAPFNRMSQKRDYFVKGATFALQNQWISVKEDLPEYNVAVIAMEYNPELSLEDQSILFAHRSKNPDVWKDKNNFCIYPPTIMKITHWMEIPSLKGGEG